MINKPGAAEIRYLKELRAWEKTGQGVTKSVESLKPDSFWRSEQAMGSAYIWNSINMDGVKDTHSQSF